MRNIKQINIKNGTHYFFNEMINIKDFDQNLLKIDKKSYKNIGIYNIGYITIKKINDYGNIHGVNPVYLMIGKVNGYTEENNGSKCLVFNSSDENKEVLKKYKEFWNGIKNKIEIINDDECKYGKRFTNIK